jgi:hypothetical protein
MICILKLMQHWMITALVFIKIVRILDAIIFACNVID